MILQITHADLSITCNNKEFADHLNQRDEEFDSMPRFTRIIEASSAEGEGMFLEFIFQDRNGPRFEDDEFGLLATISPNQMRHLRDFITTLLETEYSE